MIPTTVSTYVNTERALQLAHRHFDGTLFNVLQELLQNSRRAEAKSAWITLEEIDDRTCRVVVEDDGLGLNNPATLLGLYETGWDETTRVTEDPAGVGIFSLRGRNTKIASKDWEIRITPQDWEGGEIPVCPVPLRDGMRVEFRWDESKNDALTRLTDHGFTSFARFCGLRVSVNGKALETKDFIPEKAYVETHHRVRIGLVMDERPGEARLHWNFHGFTGSFFPWSHLCDMKGFSEGVLYLDIREAEALRPVLPARKALFRDDGFQKVMDEIPGVIFRGLKQHKIAHQLPWLLWSKAKAMGIDLIEADPNVRYFYDGRQSRARLSTLDEPLRLQPHQADWQRWLQLGLADRTLVTVPGVYKGYRFYDELESVKDISIRVAGEEVELDDCVLPEKAETEVVLKTAEGEIRYDPLVVCSDFGTKEWEFGGISAWTLSANAEQDDLGDILDFFCEEFRQVEEMSEQDTEMWEKTGRHELLCRMNPAAGLEKLGKTLACEHAAIAETVSPFSYRSLASVVVDACDGKLAFLVGDIEQFDGPKEYELEIHEILVRTRRVRRYAQTRDDLHQAFVKTDDVVLEVTGEIPLAAVTSLRSTSGTA